MKRTIVGMVSVGVCLMSFVLLAGTHARANTDHERERADENRGRGDESREHGDDSRVRQGFRISPVPLDLHHRDRELVGLGSYLVNAVGSCNDCHSCPSYAPGHDPYGPPFGPVGGGDGQINAANYLAGGVPFFPPGVYSANLTPDPVTGKPEGHSFAEFRALIRTGHDPDQPDQILQVMPWPVLRNMSDGDLRAIYEYLSAIPPATPGTCVAPGQ
jgi:hypothetical protein